MTIRNKKIFITGGSGFIGSHLIERLIKENEIVVYDNGHRDALSFTKLREHPNLRFIQGDVLDKETLSKAMDGCNMVVHLAAIAGIDTVIKKPIVTMKVNLLGTHHALEAAVNEKIERFIDFSTSEVYGPYVYKAEEDGLTTQGRVGEMRWTYSVSKLAAEHLAHCFYEEYNLPVVTIRPFNVYGPRQVGEGAMHVFIVKAIKNEGITIYGDGTQIRAWCYIDDFAGGVLSCLERKEAIGEVFNIGDPKQTITTLGLAEKIIRISGSSSKIIFKERIMPDVSVRVPSIHKAENLLDYHPQMSIEEGIKRTLAWYKERK